MDSEHLSTLIDTAYENPQLLSKPSYAKAVRATIEQLDLGRIRVAEKRNGEWMVNIWVKKAILLYFRIQKMHKTEIGPFEFYDKIPVKTGFEKLKVRVVPPGMARYGSYLAPGVILMPGYVNIGAYVDSDTMVDTHATVGSCAQVGKGVHLAGAARVGGVLEPPQGKPVIIEDHVFLGSAVSVMEGVLVREEAVLGAGVVLTASTRIIDVSGSVSREMKGEVPARSIVIPGSYPKSFPSGIFNVNCALIIGQRSLATDKKVSLNQVLRDFNISV